MDDADGCPATGRHVRPLKFTLKSGSGGECDVAWIFFFFLLQLKKRERGKDKDKQSVETESRTVEARGWGWAGSSCLRGESVSLGRGESSGKNNGDGCTTLRMYFCHRAVHLEMVRAVSVLCGFYHSFFKKLFFKAEARKALPQKVPWAPPLPSPAPRPLPDSCPHGAL